MAGKIRLPQGSSYRRGGSGSLRSSVGTHTLVAEARSVCIPTEDRGNEEQWRCPIKGCRLLFRPSVIRNGVDLGFFFDQPCDDAFADSLGVKDKFVAVYVGTHGMAHGLDAILDAAEMLRDREDIVFLTAGDGAERARLQSELERRGLQNVKMLGQLPKEKMPALWSITSASLVLLKKLDLFLTVIPSKIFETMAMKKPIILGVLGESREIVEKAGSGIGIEPENAKELAAAITALADAPDKCAAMGEAGKACVSAEFDRRVLARRFEEVLESVV